ncbi:hypothetical protein OROMI_015557 [Orobanche minor]
MRSTLYVQLWHSGWVSISLMSVLSFTILFQSLSKVTIRY